MIIKKYNKLKFIKLIISIFIIFLLNIINNYIHRYPIFKTL